MEIDYSYTLMNLLGVKGILLVLFMVILYLLTLASFIPFDQRPFMLYVGLSKEQRELANQIMVDFDPLGPITSPASLVALAFWRQVNSFRRATNFSQYKFVFVEGIAALDRLDKAHISRINVEYIKLLYHETYCMTIDEFIERYEKRYLPSKRFQKPKIDSSIITNLIGKKIFTSNIVGSNDKHLKPSTVTDVVGDVTSKKKRRRKSRRTNTTQRDLNVSESSNSSGDELVPSISPQDAQNLLSKSFDQIKSTVSIAENELVMSDISSQISKIQEKFRMDPSFVRQGIVEELVNLDYHTESNFLGFKPESFESLKLHQSKYFNTTYSVDTSTTKRRETELRTCAKILCDQVTMLPNVNINLQSPKINVTNLINDSSGFDIANSSPESGNCKLDLFTDESQLNSVLKCIGFEMDERKNEILLKNPSLNQEPMHSDENSISISSKDLNR